MPKEEFPILLKMCIMKSDYTHHWVIVIVRQIGLRGLYKR